MEEDKETSRMKENLLVLAIIITIVFAATGIALVIKSFQQSIVTTSTNYQEEQSFSNDDRQIKK